MFKPEATSLPIYFKEKQAFKNAPLNSDGQIDASVQGKIKEFLMDRDHDLEEFAPKRLTEEQQAKITEITNFLTGKASSSFSGAKEAKPSSDDFDFEDNFSGSPATTASATEDEDDFFNDL